MNGLVVENSQVKIIENQKLIIEGNIIIKPNGTLIIKNSDITLNSHYKNQYWILINSGGLFLVENSILLKVPFQIWLRLENSEELKILDLVKLLSSLEEIMLQ